MTARVWDVITGREVFSLLHDGSVDSVAWSPSGQYLATGGRDQRVRVWDVSPPDAGIRALEPESHEPFRVFQGHRGWIKSVAWSPDGQYVASCGKDGGKIWDLTQENERLTVHDAIVVSKEKHFEPGPVAWSPDDNFLAYEWTNGEPRICDAATGDEVLRGRPGVRCFWRRPDSRQPTRSPSSCPRRWYSEQRSVGACCGTHGSS